MIHTSFVFQNVLRLHAHDLDVSATLDMPRDFFIDLIFEFGEEVCSQNVAHNLSRIEEWNEIKLSDRVEISYLEDEGNNLLKILVESCKKETSLYKLKEQPLNE